MASRITPAEIDLLSSYIFDISGIHIGKDKGYLLETRLSPLLNLAECNNFTELYRKSKSRPGSDLEKALIDAISTNETFFFRDKTPFELLKNKIIPELIDLRCRQYPHIPTPLRIWSAACSTGQEVYSIAITLLEMLPDLSRYDISILGTDISNKALAQASYGQYNQFEVGRGMPDNLLRKYFHNVDSANWRINDEVRMLAKFENKNLMHDLGSIGRFDVIFCRNVAIYFNQTNKIKLFKKLAQNLAPDGALIIGGSETLRGFTPDFEAKQYLKGIFYQLKGSKKEQADQDVRNKRKKVTDSGRLATPSPPKKKIPAPSPTRKRSTNLGGQPKASKKKKAEVVHQDIKAGRIDPNKEKIAPQTNDEGQTLFESIVKKSNSPEKSSLLTARGMRRSTGNSLVNSQKNKRKKKRSLLDRINSKNNQNSD